MTNLLSVVAISPGPGMTFISWILGLFFSGVPVAFVAGVCAGFNFLAVKRKARPHRLLLFIGYLVGGAATILGILLLGLALSLEQVAFSGRLGALGLGAAPFLTGFLCLVAAATAAGQRN